MPTHLRYFMPTTAPALEGKYWYSFDHGPVRACALHWPAPFALCCCLTASWHSWTGVPATVCLQILLTLTSVSCVGALPGLQHGAGLRSRL